MKISFEGIGQDFVTFVAGQTAEVSKVCMVGGNDVVDICADGEVFCGVVGEIRGGAAAVQMSGYCELPYSGADLAVGYEKLVADGAGGVKSGAGREYLIVNVDTTAKVVGLFL